MILFKSSLSSFSIVPSFEPTSINVFSSSSVTIEPSFFMSFSAKKTTQCESLSKSQIIGKKIFSKIESGTELKLAIFSGYSEATVFGIICPNTVIKKAVANGAIALPLAPRNSMARAVAIADAREFKKFVPIKTVVRSLSIFDFNFAMILA